MQSGALVDGGYIILGGLGRQKSVHHSLQADFEQQEPLNYCLLPYLIRAWWENVY